MLLREQLDLQHLLAVVDEAVEAARAELDLHAGCELEGHEGRQAAADQDVVPELEDTSERTRRHVFDHGGVVVWQDHSVAERDGSVGRIGAGGVAEHGAGMSLDFPHPPLRCLVVELPHDGLERVDVTTPDAVPEHGGSDGHLVGRHFDLADAGNREAGIGDQLLVAVGDEVELDEAVGHYFCSFAVSVECYNAYILVEALLSIPTTTKPPTEMSRGRLAVNSLDVVHIDMKRST